MRALLVTLTTCAFILPVQARYSGGTGEPNDPYQVATAEDLMLLGDSPEDYDQHFILTADIDLDPNLPEGQRFDRAVIAPDMNDVESEFQGTAFSGVFDGRGHRISHLTVTGGSYRGLFGRLGSGAQVKALAVMDVNVAGSGWYVGGLAGWNGGTVTDCCSTGAVRGSEAVGGLVGCNEYNHLTGDYGCLIHCHSSASVSGGRDVGGLVGGNDGSVTACYSIGAVMGGSSLGGLAGWNGGNIIECYSTGGAGSSLWWVGGLVGYNRGDLTYCHSAGAASGDEAVGGLVGKNGAGTVTHCYSTGMVSGTEDVGGLVGENDQGTVTSCFWDTTVSGQAESAGGIGKSTQHMLEMQTYLEAGWDWAGEIENGISEIWHLPEGGGYPILTVFTGDTASRLPGLGTPEEPYLISDVNELGSVIHHSPYAHYRLVASIDLAGIRWGTSVVPWFGGVFDGNSLTISHLTVTGERYLGLFGKLAHVAEVKDLGVVDANVTGRSGCVGGLVGDSYGMVMRCYSTGEVKSSGNSVGGLVGYNESAGEAVQCYSAANVSGDGDCLGGLAGNNRGNIEDCYSIGSVSGGNFAGGLAGYISRGKVMRCYSAGAVSGGLFVGGLAGREYPDSWTWTASFWDIQTSERAHSDKGAGKTTAEMQTATTFLEAGWDFVGETENGTEDIWWILEGQDYPRLWWEAPAE